MTSLQFQAILQLLRANPTPPDIPLAERRAAADRLAAQTPLLDGVYTEEMAVPAEECTIPALLVAAQSARDDRLILYFHGGGYATGSIATHRDLACRLSAVSGARVLLVDYRLAPEHPFPAAVADGTAVYHYILQNGFAPEQIILGGRLRRRGAGPGRAAGPARWRTAAACRRLRPLPLGGPGADRGEPAKQRRQ